MAEKYKTCSPLCELFSCSQRALTKQRGRIYCKWADDDCVGSTCNYSLCVQGRLLSNGVCGISVRRKTKEEVSPESIKLEEIKLKGKLRSRFKNEDLI